MRNTTKPAIVAVDLDNVLVSGNRYDQVDIARFMNSVVAEVGRNCVVRVFANGMPEALERTWVRYGAKVQRTRTNADREIESFLLEGREADTALVVSGDHFFVNVCRWHVRLGHRVIVWTRARRASVKLVLEAGAARVDFIDDLIRTGPVRCPA